MSQGDHWGFTIENRIRVILSLNNFIPYPITYLKNYRYLTGIRIYSNHTYSFHRPNTPWFWHSTATPKFLKHESHSTWTAEVLLEDVTSAILVDVMSPVKVCCNPETFASKNIIPPSMTYNQTKPPLICLGKYDVTHQMRGHWAKRHDVMICRRRHKMPEKELVFQANCKLHSSFDKRIERVKISRDLEKNWMVHIFDSKLPPYKRRPHHKYYIIVIVVS